MDRQTDGQIERWLDRKMVRQTKGQMTSWTDLIQEDMQTPGYI